MTHTRIVMGIDPGSIKSGYAFLKVSGKKVSIIDSGTIKLGAKNSLFERYEILKKEIKRLIEEHQPSEIAMESLIYVKSPTALIKLAQARGVILSCILENHLERFFEYSPNLVKSTAVGYGHADKGNVQKSIGMLLGKTEFETDDESDAIAVALCHALSGQNQLTQIPKTKAKKGRGLSSALSHKIKDVI